MEKREGFFGDFLGFHRVDQTCVQRYWQALQPLSQLPIS